MATGLFKAAAVLVAIGAIGIGAWSVATRWAPSSRTYPLQGIDLGENPPPVEWGTVRARGADFAYLVATAGPDRRAPSFEANWAALPEAGLRRGAVHLYSLCAPGDKQADAFNTFVPRSDDALPAALDVAFRDDCAARPDRARLLADLRTFIARVEVHTGKPLILRVARPMEAAYGITAAIDRPVWAMADLIRPSYTARAWRLWRASDFRRVEGIAGPVNWDVVAP